jgi:hypothetical protein
MSPIERRARTMTSDHSGESEGATQRPWYARKISNVPPPEPSQEPREAVPARADIVGFEKSVSRRATALAEGDEEIAWRIEAMLAQIVDGRLPKEFYVERYPPEVGVCWSCREPQPYQQDGKCGSCALAAVKIVRASLRGDLSCDRM